tara:strand:+ start:302 stop:424 length:123 start_codon:yes stop_codon:yes gene_type:complete
MIYSPYRRYIKHIKEKINLQHAAKVKNFLDNVLKMAIVRI